MATHYARPAAAQPTAASLLDFSHLSASTKAHLEAVYKNLAMTMAAAAAGTLASMALNLGNLTLVATLGIIACIIYLSSTRGQNTHERRMALLGLGFLSGISVAPLVEIVASIDPAIPVKAFAGAAAVFGCFHVAALRSNDRSFLFLGGVLGSMLMGLVVLGIVNIFVQSTFLLSAQLYGGLLLFSGFVIYDTQVIVFKHSLGDNDAIWHSVDLFIDFMAIFKRLMIILAQNKEGDQKRRSRR